MTVVKLPLVDQQAQYQPIVCRGCLALKGVRVTYPHDEGRMPEDYIGPSYVQDWEWIRDHGVIGNLGTL